MSTAGVLASTVLGAVVARRLVCGPLVSGPSGAEGQTALPVTNDTVGDGASIDGSTTFTLATGSDHTLENNNIDGSTKIIMTGNQGFFDSMQGGVNLTSSNAAVAPVVNQMAVDKDGNVIVVGNFLFAGNTLVNNIARWNVATKTWSALGTGVNSPSISQVAIDTDGRIFVCGPFTVVGGNVGNRVQFFQGGTWYPLLVGANNGITADTVTSITCIKRQGLPDAIAIGGTFTGATSFGATSSNICVWIPPPNSVASPTTPGTVVTQTFMTTSINNLEYDALDDRIYFTLGSAQDVPTQIRYLGYFVFNGSALLANTLGLNEGFNSGVRVSQRVNGSLYATGAFTSTSTSISNVRQLTALARYDPLLGQWFMVGQGGVGTTTRIVASLSDGRLVVVGNYGLASGQPISRVAILENGIWHPIYVGTNAGVGTCVVVNDVLYLGGQFSAAMGRACSLICAIDLKQLNRVGGDFLTTGVNSSSASFYMEGQWIELLRQSGKWSQIFGAADTIQFIENGNE